MGKSLKELTDATVSQYIPMVEDINWTLKLFHKSNTILFEGANSPVIYEEAVGVGVMLKGLNRS